ncbi:MAG: hypothetical protein A3G35_18230 [candidate division NC10 bacterium RIFCSPLOWO2_12_FULL_66_18]|nr:MAG: hypothetical protein A3H39_07110 [candidate division NC10 bacterium RIFCSPLOWO2_02_FULL_66_22]OGC00431.1 MAG: hypothetical protein A3G35_18230 [candidate division NC10 bacterium RIFCSPLOWO2_12_FULL_66_18]
MAKTKERSPRLFLPGWDNDEHVSLTRNRHGELELRFTGSCGGCRESFPDMQRTIQTIAQKTSMTLSEATAFYLGFTVGVDSVRRYHRLGDFLDDDEVLEEFFGGKPMAGRFH